MLLGDAQPYFLQFRRLLESINGSLCTASTTPATISGGTGNIPAGFKTVTIVATTAPATITFPDSSTYSLATVGETLTLTAPNGTILPALTISVGAVKWVGSK